MSTYARTRVEGHDYEASIGTDDRVVVAEDGRPISEGVWMDEEIARCEPPLRPEVKEAIEDALKG